MLKTESTVLLLVDVQEKLAGAMHEADLVIENTRILLQGARLLNVPVLATEQVNLGPTLPSLVELVDNWSPIEKKSFSCYGESRFVDALEKQRRLQILLCGIECHICVYQTAMDLLKKGYEVQVVADCVSSRRERNRDIGLDRMKSEGIEMTSTEMALFELLKVAEGDRIRALSRLVK